MYAIQKLQHVIVMHWIQHCLVESERQSSLLMLDACVALQTLPLNWSSLHFSEIEIEWLPLELNGIEYNRRDDESLLMFTWWYKCLV